MIPRTNIILLAIVTTILLLDVPTIQSHKTICNQHCAIAVENDTYVISQLKNNSKEILYMTLHAVDRSRLFNQTENVLFALTQFKFGLRFMVMPVDLILMSMLLSETFVGNVDVRIFQYPNHCYLTLGANQRDHCTFKALKRLHKLASNCSGATCGRFCRRELNTSTSLDNIKALCCPMMTEDEVCNMEDRIPPLLVVFRYLSIIFSFLLSANLLYWLISDIPLVQRKVNTGSSTKPEYVKLQLVSKYKYEGITNRGRRFFQRILFRLLLWMRYVILFIFAISGFTLSIWMQFYPYDFVTVPKLFYIYYPIKIVQVVTPFICLNGCFMIIAIIPIFHGINRAVEDDIVHKNQTIMEYIEKHFVLRLSWYTDKWMKLASKLSNKRWCSIRLWWKLLTLLLVIVFYLPFAAINKLSFGFTHNAIRNTDIIAYRLFQTFHCESKQFSYKILMTKAIIYLIAVLYYFTTMGFIWAFLQLLARMFLTYIAFFAVHSHHFSRYIGPALPFIYFAGQAILSYSRDRISLSRDILELRDEIESEVEDYLNASQGYLEIIFTITSKGIHVDLPVRLENLREVIQVSFSLLAIQHDTHFRGEQQSIFIQFKENGIDTDGDKLYDIRFSRFDNQLNDLRKMVMEELNHQQLQFLRLNLKPFYYELNDSTSELTDLGIPAKFHDYLYHHAPGLALNFQNLMLRLVTIASIALFFFTAVSSFNDKNDITVLSSALSGTLLSYLGMIISLSHLTDSDLDQQKRQGKIKKYIINYILGYTFFYTKYKTARPYPLVKQTLDNGSRASTKRINTKLSTVA